MAIALLVLVTSACGGGGATKTEKWTLLPEAPLDGRFFPAAAWTGDELVVWGGGSCSGDFCNSGIAAPRADGAAYDPATNRWRTIAASPLTGRVRTQEVFTGSELIVWGGHALLEPLTDGAAYDPAADRWRTIAPSPLSGRFGATEIWTGREMIVWGGGQGGQDADRVFADGAAYDPATNRWRAVAPSPLIARIVGPAVWTGNEMVVWGGNSPDVPGGDGSPAALADGAAYDPAADRWRPLPKSPLEPRGTGASVWTGREVLMWGGGNPVQSFNNGAAYDPAADTWRVLADAPLQPRRATASAWTGERLVVWGGGPDNSLVFYGSGATYDPATDSWEDIPAWNARFAPVSAWTGDELIVWGGIFAPEKIEVLADGARLAL